jgi:2-dehydro-3-deoxygalactonokinase
MTAAALVAVDWGTSSLRGALLDARGQVIAERAAPRGILTVVPGTFPAVFAELFGDWMGQAGHALICGMAGSRQGWAEAPYCPAPAALADLAARLHWVLPGRVGIVPGVTCDMHGVPDVMRGEETQVIGSLRITGLQDATLVLPGTHSKWVQVRGGAIAGFRTFMTGEIFALLAQHSILARTLQDDGGVLDEEAFRVGVRHARDHAAGLLHGAFSARTLSLFDRLPAAAGRSYLSGLVIGEELRAAAPPAGSDVVLTGGEALTQRYAIALEAAGVRGTRIGSEAAWAGLWAIAQALPAR